MAMTTRSSTSVKADDHESFRRIRSPREKAGAAGRTEGRAAGLGRHDVSGAYHTAPESGGKPSRETVVPVRGVRDTFWPLRDPSMLTGREWEGEILGGEGDEGGQRGRTPG